MSNPNRDKLVDMSKSHYFAWLNEEKKMSNDPKDTQFAGWAKAVLDELVHTPNIDVDPLYDFKLEEWQRILARAGYDLVMHAFETVDSSIYKRWLSGENIPLFDALVDTIPDMAELPEEQER